jgi:hypothetical protein
MVTRLEVSMSWEEQLNRAWEALMTSAVGSVEEQRAEDTIKKMLLRAEIEGMIARLPD